MATASGDKTLRLWALADGTCLKTFEGHTASVLRLNFLSAGTQVSSPFAKCLLIYTCQPCFVCRHPKHLLACAMFGDCIYQKCCLLAARYLPPCKLHGDCALSETTSFVIIKMMMRISRSIRMFFMTCLSIMFSSSASHSICVWNWLSCGVDTAELLRSGCRMIIQLSLHNLTMPFFLAMHSVCHGHAQFWYNRTHSWENCIQSVLDFSEDSLQ